MIKVLIGLRRSGKTILLSQIRDIILERAQKAEGKVYLEMLSRGYEVKVGKLDSQEVDFVCYKGRQRIYIQVAYLLTENCIDREFGNPEKIDDNYPKYVISGDLVDLSRKGIIHCNMIDFLLGGGGRFRTRSQSL